MKGIERVIEKIIKERISTDDMQFGFMPGRGTTDAIFVLRHLQEKHLAKNKKLYFAFVDLEKAFDRVPRKVIWWAMRKLGIEEWIVRFVQAMYNNTRSRVNPSIYCAGYSHWVHKKCSGVIGGLKSNPDYRCSRCKGTARPIDGRSHNEWLLMQDKKLDVVDSFCYLGDTIGAGGGGDLSVITRI